MYDEKDRVYKFLNPLVFRNRLNAWFSSASQDARRARITLSIGAGGEQGILIPWQRCFRSDTRSKVEHHYAAPHMTKEGSVAVADDEWETTTHSFAVSCGDMVLYGSSCPIWHPSKNAVFPVYSSSSKTRTNAGDSPACERNRSFAARLGSRHVPGPQDVPTG
jgi:hypothetical protein